MKRRDFLKAFGAAAATATIVGLAGCTSSTRKRKTSVRPPTTDNGGMTVQHPRWKQMAVNFHQSVRSFKGSKTVMTDSVCVSVTTVRDGTVPEGLLTITPKSAVGEAVVPPKTHRIPSIPGGTQAMFTYEFHMSKEKVQQINGYTWSFDQV